MKRLEDLEDSPLVPALIAKLHEEGDRTLMDVSVTRIEFVGMVFIVVLV